MPSPISRIRKSLTRHLMDMAVEYSTLNGQPLTYYDWEQRAEENTYPQNAMIGLNGFNFEENGGLWIVRFGISVSTYLDTGLFEEGDILDCVFDWFHEKSMIPLRDMLTGDENEMLYVTAFEIAPMLPTQLRNYRTVSVEAKRTRNG